MKLRHIYYLILMISLSNEELLKQNHKNSKHGHTNLRRKVRKRQNYEINDEKEPLAQIDVSNFIHNPDDNTVDELYSDLLEERKRNGMDVLSGDDDGVNQFQFEKNPLQDYQKLENDPEQNIYYERNVVPENVNVNQLPDSSDIKTNEHNIGEFHVNIPNLEQAKRNIEKKCSFNKMKLPFFSHNKTEKTKTKKNKKRKFIFFNSKTQTPSVTKLTESHLNSEAQLSTKEPQDFKIKKRSYFERLCPACKQKILNANLFEDKTPGTGSNVIHNSRQYYQRRDEESKNVYNRQDTPYTKQYNFGQDIMSTTDRSWNLDSLNKQGKYIDNENLFNVK